MWSNGLFEQLYMSLSPLFLCPAPTSLLSASAQLYVCYTDAFSGHPHPITWPLPSKDKLGDEDFFYVKLNKVPILPWKPSQQVEWKEVKTPGKVHYRVKVLFPLEVFHTTIQLSMGQWGHFQVFEMVFWKQSCPMSTSITFHLKRVFFFFQLYFLFCLSVFSIFLEPNFLQF